MVLSAPARVSAARRNSPHPNLSSDLRRRGIGISAERAAPSEGTQPEPVTHGYEFADVIADVA
jgi:hypothetical protein